ncbi:MAG: metal ABC transporter substrate-binding protein [Candidatus Sericytochromatia bacterium]|nr:metal ABC transporter substrate-binding protein [Candidatus Sericytochromatia bacterium]
MRPMSRLLILLLVLVAARPAEAARRVAVVATVPDVGAVVSAVGGEDIALVVMAEPTQDAHFVDARPHLALQLSRADLLVAIGLDLEAGWLPRLQVGARQADIQVGRMGYLEVGPFAQLLEIPRMRMDRSFGDVHASGNPHVLLDPRNAGRIAIGVADRLARLDPERAQAYRDRARRFRTEAEKVAAAWQARARDIPAARRKMVTYHRSLSYLANWLSIEVVDTLEPQPGIAPTPAHIKDVLVRIPALGVPLIAQEPWYPERVADLVAKRAGIRRVTLPVLEEPTRSGAYLAWIEATARMVCGGLAP